MTSGSKSRERIVVPQRMIQGGFDFKFETDPYDVRLYGILSEDEYTDAITALNEKISPARSSKLDAALLITGPLLVPLAAWGVRHSRQVKKRKKLLNDAILEFHERRPDLLMRWNRRPESSLTIERRYIEVGVEPPASSSRALVAVATEVNQSERAAHRSAADAASSQQPPVLVHAEPSAVGHDLL